MEKQPLRVLMVIPAMKKDDISMIFAKRHIDLLENSGLIVERYFLESRTSIIKLIKSLDSFCKLQCNFKPDIVHSHYGTMTSLFCAIAAKPPLVITFRGSDLNPDKSAGRLRILINHLISQISSIRSKRIICVSKQLKSRLWLSSVRSKTVVIPSPVNLALFEIINKDEARKLLGWMKEDKVVLFNASKDQKGKRLDLAQDAVREARRYVKNIRFVVLDGKIPPNKVPVFMNASDCLLLTSDYEGSPNVVKEAMACNLPIVAVEVGDVVERLKEVYPSKIAKRNSIELGLAIVDIMRKNRRSNGRTVIMRDLNETTINRNTMNVYYSALIKNNVELE